MKTYLAVASMLLGAALLMAQQDKPIEKPPAQKAVPPLEKNVPAKAAAKKTPAEPILVARRNLPRYYTKLGLTDKQKKAIYKTLAAYAAQTERLKQELEALKEKEREDIEAFLTAAQRDRLKELRSK
ncbi:MAG: hypothetical protein ACRELF_11295 [Gemmataceae bacterium]